MKIKNFFKAMSLESQGIRYRVIIAYCLAAVIPLLVATYLATTYVFPDTKNMLWVSSSLLITLAIAIFGLSLLREMVNSIIRIARQAYIISDGDSDIQIEIQREDEIGQIARSINMLVQKIKDSMAELGSYGAKAKRIDVEIHKNVLTMSGLLNIINLISSGSKLDEVSEFVLDKVVELEGVTDAFILMIDEDKQAFVVEQAKGPNVSNMTSKSYQQNKGLIGRIAKKANPFVLDSKTKTDKEIDEFIKGINIANIGLLPITARGTLLGFLAAGNTSKGFAFSQDSLDTLDIFAKHVGVAAENELLATQPAEYAVTDDLTGIYNKAYILNRLKEELHRALVYQRPCSFLMLDVDNFRAYREICGGMAAEQALKHIAEILNEHTSEVDKVARFEEDMFAVVLPEKNKRDAVKTAEELRRRIEAQDIRTERQGTIFKLTVSGGVSENPIDGSTYEELLKKATDSVKKAKSEGKNRIQS